MHTLIKNDARTATNIAIVQPEWLYEPQSALNGLILKHFKTQHMKQSKLLAISLAKVIFEHPRIYQYFGLSPITTQYSFRFSINPEVTEKEFAKCFDKLLACTTIRINVCNIEYNDANRFYTIHISAMSTIEREKLEALVISAEREFIITEALKEI